MATKILDLIVFGASGFTGRLVAQYIHKHKFGLKWAIAGRSQARLADIVAELKAFDPEQETPQILIADAGNIDSLVAAFETSLIVLNCTGPYRFLGNNVITACLQSRSHYIDICGEPQFMEASFLMHHDEAVRQKVLILHACAFDSVPADLGALLCLKQFPLNCCTSIESYLTINSSGNEGFGIHYTTYECAVHGFGDTASLRQTREAIKNKYNLQNNLTRTRKEKKSNNSGYYCDKVNKYVVPFLGADSSVVRSTQRSLSLMSHSGDNTIDNNAGASASGANEDMTKVTVWPRFSAYITIANIGWLAVTALAGSTFSLLAGSEGGRSLLLSYPSFFTAGLVTHQGPSEAQLRSTSFEMRLFATGTVNDSDNMKNNNNNIDISNKDTTAAEEPIAKTDVGKNTCFSSFADSSNNNNSSSSTTNTLNEKHVEVVVTGPEPGYVATPAIVVTLIQVMLTQLKTNPPGLLPSGGVFTPGAAFRNVPDIFDRLGAAGVTFTVESK